MPDWLRRIRWQLLAIALVFGGIVHILATLVVPRLTMASAWHRLAPKLPVNRMVVQPLATPGTQPLPFIGPDTRFAFCRYDLSQGPMVLTATLPEKGWSIGLYSTDGDNFFSITAQEQRRTDVRLTLTPPAERLLGIFNWGRSVDATLSDVVVPRVEGLVVIRAPIRGRAYQSETEAVLGSARCTPRG
jgi:uncharacterized membrane protein